MRYKRSKISEKLSAFLFFLCVITIFVIAAINISVTKHYAEIAESEGKKLSAYVISFCVETVLKSQAEQYGELVKITYDENGKITSVEADPAKINSIQGLILKEVNKSLSNNESFSAKVPIGTLSGSSLLAGRGPAVELQFDQKGSAKITLKNEFDTGGINQTVHRLYAHIETQVYCISPFESEPIFLDFDFLLSETVIVGEVPQNLFSSGTLN